MPEDNIQIIKQDNVEIRIIRDECISAAICLVYAPKTFDLDEKEIAIIREEAWDDLGKIISAAKACPTLAIEVYKDGQKVFP